MRTHVQPGKVVSFTASGTSYSAGDLVPFGALTGIACGNIADGETGEIFIEEVFTVQKRVVDVITVGQQLYLDAENKKVTTSSDDEGCPNTSYIKAGKAMTAAGNGATTVNIKLNV